MACPYQFEDVIADMNEELQTILQYSMVPSLAKCFKNLLYVFLRYELDVFL